MGEASIACLRFWFRDPRQDHEEKADTNEDKAAHSTAAESGNCIEIDSAQDETKPNSRTSFVEREHPGETYKGIFGQARDGESSIPSFPPEQSIPSAPRPNTAEPIELRVLTQSKAMNSTSNLSPVAANVWKLHVRSSLGSRANPATTECTAIGWLWHTTAKCRSIVRPYVGRLHVPRR